MGNMQLLFIFSALSLGILNAQYAKKRGRIPLLWFGIGVMIGIFGLMILFLLPKIVKTNDSLSKPKGPSPIKRSDSWLKMWYYLDSMHVQQGPFEFPDLITTWKEKRISESTYIWGEGMSEWRQLRDHPELIQEFDQV